MEEIYKDIPGYEGIYQVNNFGDVKSLRNGKGKILKSGLSVKGYKNVYLYKDGIRKYKENHQLVAEAFLNHTPCGMKLVINHLNKTKTDNRVENLEIISQRKNVDRKNSKSTSKYIGVSFNKSKNKWVAQFYDGNKQTNLGAFENEIDAHNAYQKRLKNFDTQRI